MFTLNQPLPEAQNLIKAKPSMPSLTAKPNFILRLIQRDLKFFTERHLYYAEIEISSSANRVTTVDVEDFSLSAATIATDTAQLSIGEPYALGGSAGGARVSVSDR